MNHLTFLIGFMGAGKTTLGHAAADALGYTFLDLDDLIEKREAKSIRDIFEEKGEAYFRQLESNLLKSLIFLPPAQYIVATGGGTPCFQDNMTWMKRHGKVIYLNPSVEELSERLYREMEKRPILKGVKKPDLQHFISNLLQTRKDFYLQAHHQLSGEKLALEALIELIDQSYEL